MEDKITVSRIETRDDRRDYKSRRYNRNDPKNGPINDSSSSTSSQSKVVILAKKPQNITLLTKSFGDQQLNQQANVNKSNISVTTSQVQSNQNQHQSNAPTANSASQNSDETINDLLNNIPSVIKLIDGESLLFMESPACDYLLSDSMSSGRFSVITAVGMQNVGKSTLLNKIAGKDVFKTHKNCGDNILKHVTKGIDLHITKERLLLLDSQPLLSASVLDDYIKLPPSPVVNISEPENYAFMTSLQLLSFLFATCDYIIVVSDWIVDIHLIKLITTAVMMVGDGAQKANIIWYFNEKCKKFNSSTIELLLGRGLCFSVICKDQDELLKAIMKCPANKLIGDSGNTRNTLHISEKSWLNSSKSIWENSICKSTLYSDYGHFLP